MSKIKNYIAVVTILLSTTTIVNAQLSNGSTAPDFTVTDINGNSHHLYEYLDSGYTVILDLSAVWCGPCWSYHEAGHLETLWKEHGPAGETGVDANTTDDVIVLWVEGDSNTPESYISGGGNSQGDWTEGTDYPLINDDNLASAYSISYWPTIYTICPNRKLKLSGSISAEAHYNLVEECEVAVEGINASVSSYSGEYSTCGEEVNVKAVIQNLGTENLSSFNVKVFEGSNELGSESYNGSALATYASTEVDFGNIPVSGNTNLEIKITDSDALGSDNSLTQEITLAKTAYQNLRIKITLDNFGEEISWKIKSESGTEIASGGPYSNSSNQQSFEAQPQDDVFVQVEDDGCYIFEVTDSYGDGMYGDEQTFFKVFDANNLEVVTIYGNQFEEGISQKFLHEGGSTPLSINEKSVSSSSIHPNPTNGLSTLKVDAKEKANNVALNVINIMGEVVLANSINLNVGANSIPLKLAHLEAGIYTVELTSTSVNISHKLVKLD